ncbi:MAG TPA: CHAP domain-containing protein [Stellaceae bacterium]|nr:CHAP domain-containing protein [Stellaceae bacterium]
MRWKAIALAYWGLAILLSLPAQAAVKHHGAPSGGNCVAYARALTGIQLDGNAGLWWSHAAGRYDRGHEPKIGSVLVFKSFGHMRSGHVAVVSSVDGPRRILVDHANWIRGRVSKAMAVVDTSPNNDWTAVKVLGNRPEAGGQRDNPTFGFIYPQTQRADLGATVAKARPSHRKPVHIAARKHHKKADDAKLAYLY